MSNIESANSFELSNDELINAAIANDEGIIASNGPKTPKPQNPKTP